MKHFEITVTPLSEEAKADSPQPFTEHVDAYVLSAIREEEDEAFAIFTEAQGSEIMWGAFIGLMKHLMKKYPERTAAALATALDLVKAENGEKTMH